MMLIKQFSVILFLIILISCGVEIRTDEIFNKESELRLQICLGDKYTSDSSRIEILTKDSEKIAKVKEWFTNNPDKWKSSIASWAPADISLIGKDFRLLIYKDGVVVGFTDKEGKQRQFTRQTDKSDFDFLIEEK